MNAEHIKAFKKVLLIAAEADNCTVEEVSSRQFTRYLHGIISERLVRKLGGFTKLKKKCLEQDQESAKNEIAVIALFKADLQTVAAKFKLESPRLATKDLFNQCQTNLSTTKIDRVLGGFTKAKDTAFPPEPSPFINYDKLSPKALQEQIAESIGDCARIMRIEPHEVSWARYARYINFRYGSNDKGLARFAISDAGGFNRIREMAFPLRATPFTVAKIAASDHASVNKRLGEHASRFQFTLDRVDEYAEQIYKASVVELPCCSPKTKTERVESIYNLILSDLHFGSDIQKNKTGYLDYGAKEESRRFAHVIRSTVAYKNRLSPQGAGLNVLLLGDLIQNQLHDARDGALLAEQIARAMHNLIIGARHLAAHFTFVNFKCVGGNHDRNYGRHHKRAVMDKIDSFATVIHVAMKHALAGLPNVSFDIPTTPFVTYSNFDHRGIAAHGDTHFSDIGYPGTTVRISKMEQQANRLNASLIDTKEYSVVSVGHTHTPNITVPPSGTAFIVNGCLPPLDEHAQSIGIYESKNCGQIIFESTPDQMIENIKLIRVGHTQDAETALDRFIPPFTGF